MHAEAHELETIPLLSPEECETFRASIFGLRDHWTARHPQAPFFTLGVASYLDGNRQSTTVYEQKAAAINPLMREHFQPLYDRLLAVMTERLGRPVRFAENMALPGFHIYLAHPGFCGPVASVHCDLQYQHVNWDPHGGYIPKSHLSMTLPIALPSHGAGLAHWPIRPPSAFKDEEERKEFMRTERQFHPYTVGAMAFHSGHMLHQSVLMETAVPGEDRITLQAHGALTPQGEYLIYW